VTAPRLSRPRYLALDVRCRRCQAAPGTRCWAARLDGSRWELRHVHPERAEDARKASTAYAERSRKR
jgi:hypothetical protein